MTDKEATRVLKAHGFPEEGMNVFAKGCLYVLPIGAITSGVCLNPSSDKYDVRLIVFQQPLYFPRGGVVFWKLLSDVPSPRGHSSWDFDPDPQSETANILCDGIRERCLPLAQKRLTVEGALAQTLAELKDLPDSYYKMEDQVLSLAMLGRLHEAWEVLSRLMAGAREKIQNPKPHPKPFDWNLVDRNQHWAVDLYPRLLPLEQAFLAPDREQAVRMQMESYIEGTKKAVGLEGVP